MKRIYKLFSLLVLFVVLVISVFSVKTSINASDKELTEVIDDVKIWAAWGNSYAEYNPDNSYKLRVTGTYQLEVFYDLEKYELGHNGGVVDGDYFKLDIPSPLTVKDGTAELVDNCTKVKIADLSVKSNGVKSGGEIKVHFKNLEEFK